jgi:hypothetical protein
MSMLDNQKEYRRGEPISYTSIYGYAKVRFQIVRVEDGCVVGSAKEEIVPGENGMEATRVYYTKDIGRDYGMPRFYASPEALIVGRGGRLCADYLDAEKAKQPDDLSALKNAPKGEGMVMGESFILDPGLEARVTALENKVFLPAKSVAKSVLRSKAKPKVVVKATSRKAAPKKAKRRAKWVL